jgi:hypothetical protein
MFQYNNVLQSAGGNERARPTKWRQREKEGERNFSSTTKILKIRIEFIRVHVLHDA